MTKEQFLKLEQKILATKENQELFLQGYFDYAKSILKPTRKPNKQQKQIGA